MPTARGPSSDDDIEFVSHDHPDKIICQICDQDLTVMTVAQRESHYEEHFPEQSSEPSGSSLCGGIGGSLSGVAAKLGPKSPSKMAAPKSGFRPPATFFRKVSNEKQNVFWHASRTSEPPANFSPGLIPVLKSALIRAHEKGATQRAWLAISQAVHVHSEFWDRTWGCGYRNFLMACAALMDQQSQPMYFPLLDGTLSPGVRNMQVLLEKAWEDGYDEDGAAQLRHQIVDTTKWIGTAELYVVFTYLGIPSQLADFELKSGTEPLLRWVLDYFSGGDPQRKVATVEEALREARPVIVTDKLPIVLQHNGHSRTIVGCELGKGGAITLLTFDPAKNIPEGIRTAGLKYHNPTRTSRPGSSSLPSKVLHQVLRPVETLRTNKRKSLSPHRSSSKKRRSGEELVDGADVIVLTDDEDDNEGPSRDSPRRAQRDALDQNEVLKLFRIQSAALKRKNKYQILYFPLAEPLTDVQKMRQRVVTSEKIC